MNIANTFRVFKSRDYSLFFTGQLISRIGMWMQRTAVIWVIYSLTHSLMWVGLTVFAEQFPSFFLSPLGGIVADRYDRFKVLMFTQVGSALQAVCLTLAYYLGAHEVWLILLLSALLGMANAFDIPARQAMVNDIVKNGADLPGAIAMNASLNNFTRLAGPALSGIVLAQFGATFCFASNAVSFIAVIFCLNLMHFPAHVEVTTTKDPWKDFKDGWTFTRSDLEIGPLILLNVFICLLVATSDTLQPYFADVVFKGNAAIYGYMNAASGLGALISTLYLAGRKYPATLKQYLFKNLLLLGAGLFTMPFVTWLPLYLLCCFVCGFALMSAIPIGIMIVQMVCPGQLRGRVVAFLAMATYGTLPLGSLLIGWLAKIISPQYCMHLQGLLSFCIAGGFYKFLHREIKYPQLHTETLIAK
ncbi:Predicted arabinose efflux permease, MFS family [Chitinophaga jiangningensis]|uniref:Predicted arabinose efflux permease, MFS family n=1 Tax=Chitinophaga jiangningensis TaxID=1419482 RepID=A0A1M7J613_9BACT|nr:MFS transporter [Chitinophaga jiangningensis]SHM48580.1 Predicted arabinose efflux permease, MFS family [Chitinophaga jiangningensis]